MTARAALGELARWCYWHPFRRLIMRSPPALAYALGRVGGLALARLARGRRRALQEVLPLVGGGDPRRDGRIVRDAFVMLCQGELEVLLYPALTPGRTETLVACRGLELLDEALAGGRGAMLMFAHFGANQMIMPALGYRGYALSQLSAPPTVWAGLLPGKTFTPRGKEALEIRWRHEQSLPVRHINVFGSLKEAFRCLERNEVLGVAVDGGGGRTRVAVDFLGRRAQFSTGAMDLALRTGCAVLPVFMLRHRTGRHTLVIEPALAVDGGRDADAVRRNLAPFVRLLERYVLEYPDHYVNFLALRNEMAKRGDTPFFLS